MSQNDLISRDAVSVQNSPTSSSHHHHHHHDDLPRPSTSFEHQHEGHRNLHHQHHHQLNYQKSVCSISNLIIVLHGGSVLDVNTQEISTNINKSHDINTLRTTMEMIIAKHYPHLCGRIVLRYVPCPSICLESLLIMSSLSPHSVQHSPNADSISHKFDSIPISALPLFAISSFDYFDTVVSVINQCNRVYKEFINSDEGRGFNGKVCLIGDSIGSILGFDALCSSSLSNDSNQYYENERIGLNLSNPVISINDQSSETLTKNTVDKQQKSQTRMIALSKSKTLPISGVNHHKSGSNDDFRKLIDQDEKHRQSDLGCDRVRSSSSTNQNINVFGIGGDSTSYTYLDAFNRLQINSILRRKSSCSIDLSMVRFEFDVHDFFMFGSMIGVVMTYRKLLSLDDKQRE